MERQPDFEIPISRQGTAALTFLAKTMSNRSIDFDSVRIQFDSGEAQLMDGHIGVSGRITRGYIATKKVDQKNQPPLYKYHMVQDAVCVYPGKGRGVTVYCNCYIELERNKSRDQVIEEVKETGCKEEDPLFLGAVLEYYDRLVDCDWVQE